MMNNDLRYEIKFIADPFDNVIESYIFNNNFSFSEIFEERTIHNIYCDSELNSSYTENLHGVSDRVKVRFRWYTYKNSDTPSNVVMEIKYKKGKLGGKLFHKMGKNILEIGQQNIVEEALKTIPENLAHYLTTYSVPSLYNSYTRKYYSSADQKIRVTIDSNLNFEPLTFGYQEKNRVDIRDFNIIEVKGLSSDHEVIADFLKNFPYRPYRFSKYVVGLSNGLF